MLLAINYVAYGINKHCDRKVCKPLVFSETSAEAGPPLGCDRTGCAQLYSTCISKTYADNEADSQQWSVSLVKVKKCDGAPDRFRAVTASQNSHGFVDVQILESKWKDMVIYLIGKEHHRADSIQLSNRCISKERATGFCFL